MIVFGKQEGRSEAGNISPSREANEIHLIFSPTDFLPRRRWKGYCGSGKQCLRREAHGPGIRGPSP